MTTQTFDTLASPETIQKVVKALAERGFLPEVVSTSMNAIARIQELIPTGASIMYGSSRTLEEIGFIAYLTEGGHDWNNLHKPILAENDPVKRGALRREAALSDYYLGSVHAIIESGELMIASNSGSQLSHLVFTSPNLILVVGSQKITHDTESAMKRLNEYIFPLEDERMKNAGLRGTSISKVLFMSREPSFIGRKIHILIINEKLGF